MRVGHANTVPGLFFAARRGQITRTLISTQPWASGSINVLRGHTLAPRHLFVSQRLYSTPSGHGSKETPRSSTSTPPKPKPSFFSRFLPSSSGTDPNKSASSFRNILALAKPERKPLGIAIGLLLVSSAVSMSVPFTIGKLIDYFTTADPVRVKLMFSFVEGVLSAI